MNKNITQLHGISPEEFKKEILEGISAQLEALSKSFKPKEPDVWLTRKETSELLGVSLVTIHNWSKDRIIINYKIGNRVRFNRKEIEEILKRSNTD